MLGEIQLREFRERELITIQCERMLGPKIRYSKSNITVQSVILMRDLSRNILETL